MIFQTILASGFILLGAAVMLFSIFNTRKLLRLLHYSHYLKTWQVLMVLMAFFFLGYVGAAFLVFLDIGAVLLVLVGVVFFFGALFVFLVVRVGYLTIGDLQETTVTRDELEVQVSKRTAELMETNNTLLRSQEELAHARDEALKANRAKSIFLANMSHELRTPLNAILGYSEMLQEDLEDMGEEEMVSDLTKIHRSGDHLLNIINDILDLSKIEAGRMLLYLTEFDLGALLEDVLNAVQPLILKNNNDLQSLPFYGLGLMYADETKVRQILFNLLSNASKFTEQGIIALDVDRVERNGRSYFAFEVKDTGIGMSEEQADKLFEPFVQADLSTTRQYGGTGLGLAITKRFCEMMGGSIELESELDRGSIFTVYLPVQVAEPQPEPNFIPIGSIEGGQRVLIIDDDPVVRDLMHRFLVKEGFNAEVATGGQQGIEMAKKLQPDLITLDVIMPDMDGWAVLSALKEHEETADIPVVMLTMIDDKQRGYTLGATDYLSKPIDRDRLLRIVRRLYGRDETDQNAPVLVVEDNEPTREMLRRNLQKEGWQVLEAENGRIALEIVQEQTPALVLLDLMMPEMDGFEFVTEFRKIEHLKHIPIIVVTAKELTDEDQMHLSGYVERIIQKASYSRDALLGEVRKLAQAQVGKGDPSE